MTIFGIYFIMTVAVTIAQLTAEYYHVKKSIYGEIQTLPGTFNKGLEESLWMFNYDLIHSILVGMKQLPIVSGIKIENTNGEDIEVIGSIIDSQGNYLSVDANGEHTPLPGSQRAFIKLLSSS